jgi:hypothetical protein
LSRKVAFGLGFGAILVALSGCRHDVSGKYLATEADGVQWLQLVQTPDNHLVGQLEITSLSPDGSLKYVTLTLAGAAAGPNVNMSASEFSVQVLTLSGHFGVRSSHSPEALTMDHRLQSSS